MKIRTDFVTNSSSTSFVVITSEELTIERFLELMGASTSSPFAKIFEELYYSLGLEDGYPSSNQDDHDYIELKLLPHVRERIKIARERGLQVYIGELSSDENSIETFFCIDSFEVEVDDFFLSAVENYW